MSRGKLGRLVPLKCGNELQTHKLVNTVKVVGNLAALFEIETGLQDVDRRQTFGHMLGRIALTFGLRGVQRGQ